MRPINKRPKKNEKEREKKTMKGENKMARLSDDVITVVAVCAVRLRTAKGSLIAG